MSGKQMNDPTLDALFAEAREARPVPDADLMARILGDAAELAPQAASPMPVRARRGPLARLVDWLGEAIPGGAATAASLSTCALAGVLVGYTGLGDVPLMAGTDLFASGTAISYDGGLLGEELSYLSTEGEI